MIVDNDSNLRAAFLSYLSSWHPTDYKGELDWVLQVRVSRDQAPRTLSLSQEININDLLQRYCQLLNGLMRHFDSPYNAAATFTADQYPVPDSPEHRA